MVLTMKFPLFLLLHVLQLILWAKSTAIMCITVHFFSSGSWEAYSSLLAASGACQHCQDLHQTQLSRSDHNPKPVWLVKWDPMPASCYSAKGSGLPNQRDFHWHQRTFRYLWWSHARTKIAKSSLFLLDNPECQLFINEIEAILLQSKGQMTTSMLHQVHLNDIVLHLCVDKMSRELKFRPLDGYLFEVLRCSINPYVSPPVNITALMEYSEQRNTVCVCDSFIHTEKKSTTFASDQSKF